MDSKYGKARPSTWNNVPKRVNVWNVSPPRPNKMETFIPAKKQRQDHDKHNIQESQPVAVPFSLMKSADTQPIHHNNPISHHNVPMDIYDQDHDFSKKEDHHMMNRNEDYGPVPLTASLSSNDNQLSYGKALLPGEGSAIAAFVQQNMRIPRRGEIGWDGDDIQKLEGTGYVMSGSRHKRMNAVRIRKENQVYSAEEKRALAVISLEEKQQKDNKIVAEFRTMLQEKFTL